MRLSIPLRDLLAHRITYCIGELWQTGFRTFFRQTTRKCIYQETDVQVQVRCSIPPSASCSKITLFWFD